jgi:hypothetical protein
LNAYKPKPVDNPFAEAASSFDPIGTAEPRFPKSLYLIQPLHEVYELNPVALAAQASVPIPDGLDLDAWIVAPPPEPTSKGDSDFAARKVRKGKGKEVNGGKAKNGKKKHKEEGNGNGNGVVLTPADPEEETETAEERERVCFFRPLTTLDKYAQWFCSGSRSGENDCAMIRTTSWTINLRRRSGWLTMILIQYRWSGSTTCLHSQVGFVYSHCQYFRADHLEP